MFMAGRLKDLYPGYSSAVCVIVGQFSSPFMISDLFLVVKYVAFVYS